MVCTMPMLASAQDDLYFTTKKDVASQQRQARDNDRGRDLGSYYCGSNRDVDEYNRRGNSSYEQINADGTADDIIDFNPVVGVYPDSVGSDSIMDEYTQRRRLHRFDDSDFYDPYWSGYYAGRASSWYSPWGWHGYYGWYDPWYYDWAWYGGWYGLYDPWYYGYMGWHSPWYFGAGHWGDGPRNHGYAYHGGTRGWAPRGGRMSGQTARSASGRMTASSRSGYTGTARSSSASRRSVSSARSGGYGSYGSSRSSVSSSRSSGSFSSGSTRSSGSFSSGSSRSFGGGSGSFGGGGGRSGGHSIGGGGGHSSMGGGRR